MKVPITAWKIKRKAQKAGNFNIAIFRQQSKLSITFRYLLRLNSFIEGEIEFQILTPILVLENLT